jgi:hypothetical protein
MERAAVSSHSKLRLIVLPAVFIAAWSVVGPRQSDFLPVGVVQAQASGNNAARANSYDDAWQTAWVANAKSILAGGNGVPGMTLWIGDSLTRGLGMGAWAKGGAGKTAEDQMITTWMHASTAPQSIDSIDGFALAAPYFCSARSYTVGDGLGAWDFNGTSGMPADTNPTTARQKLQDCQTYSNGLTLVTILAAIQPAQFAIPEVNLFASNPEDLTEFNRMLNTLIAKHIVPIVITYTYRLDNNFNQLVDRYNVALKNYARDHALPLIDLQAEMLARVPFSQWDARYLSDGVHYTNGGGGYTSTSNPYMDGGDPATHTTGAPLTYNGYGLKGWLGVQKMKEIKALVIDSTPPPGPPGNLRILSSN